MEEISSLWDTSTDITDYTDTDLQYSRSHSSRQYDPDGVDRQRAMAIRDAYDVRNISSAVDMALRLLVAHTIDSGETLVTRETYDVRYTIPPQNWVHQHTFRELELPDIDTDEKYIQYSMPEVVNEMVEAMMENGLWETKRAVVSDALALCSGHE